MKRLLCLIFSIFSFLSAARAQESEPLYVPPDLQPWVRWVQERHPEWQCASVSGAFQCVWPGKIELDLRESNGTFTIAAELFYKGEFPLPGNGDLLPRNITVASASGSAVPHRAFLRDGIAFLELPAGAFRITGELRWDKFPREITVPGTYGVLSLKSHNGRQHHRGNGVVWFEEGSAAEGSVFITVHRRIADGSPLEVETLLDLRVSGAPRAMNLGPVLLQGAVPVAVHTDLAYQLFPTGELSLQLKPGDQQVRIQSVLAQPFTKLQAPASELLPPEEYWAWFADNNFRAVEVSGATPISDDLTQLPPEWRGGAAYVVQRSQPVEFKELRRGEDRPGENRLSLRREMWLDLDSEGLTVRDTFSGVMNRDFRLDALPELQLGRAVVNGQPTLITSSPVNKQAGIEIRETSLNVTAVSQLKEQPEYSAVGWSTEVTDLSGELHLSPAWRLVHISGAESATGSWLDSWTLLDVFVCVLLVVGTAQAFGRWFGVLAGASLLLMHAEFLEPRLMLIHLFLAYGLALLFRESSDFWKGTSRDFLRATFVVWLLEVLAFTKLQLTEFLFPQLQAGTRYRTLLQEIVAALESNFFIWPVVFVGFIVTLIALRNVFKAKSFFEGVLRLFLIGFLGFVVIAGCTMAVGFLLSVSRYDSSTVYRAPATQEGFGGSTSVTDMADMPPADMAMETLAIPQSAPAPFVPRMKSRKAEMERERQAEQYQTPQQQTTKSVQSGPAVPTWRWRSHYFTVAGPIPPEQTLKLYLLSPMMTRILTLLRAALLIALCVYVFRRMNQVIPFFVLLFLLFPRAAAAETPRPELLAELEQRLNQRICQDANCATIEELNITVEDNQLSLGLRGASKGMGALALPGPFIEGAVDCITVNGQPTIAMRRDEAGYLWVRVPTGSVSVDAQITLDSKAVVTLEFAQLPLGVTFSSKSWSIEGLLPSGGVRNTLRLVPLTAAGEENGESANQPQKETVLPSWFIVRRNVEIGDESRTVTSVQRIGEVSSGASVRVPLLPGETVTTGTVQVEQGEAVVRFAPGEAGVDYIAALDPGKELVLSARSLPSISEEWQLSCGPTVRCAPEGSLPIQTTAGNQAVSIWKPFPGEDVKVGITRLEGVAGDVLTLDSLSHQIDWGSNLFEGQLKAAIRVTEQQALSFQLPPGAKLTQSSLNHSEGRVLEKDGKATILLNPGTHSLSINYTVPGTPAALQRALPLGTTVAAHNVAIRVVPSQDRWILWVGGLRWGPGVLYWAKLLFVAIICVVLSQQKLVQVSIPNMVILSIGLASLPMFLVAVPLIWLASMNERFAGHVAQVKPKLRIGAFLILTFFTLGLFYTAVRMGLLVQPPMLIVGNNSTAHSLNWFTDHVTGALPQPWVFSLPMWCWRAVMLLWSTWLAVLLIAWLRRAIETTKRLAVG